MTNENFTDELRVRAYECDSLGHVNNAVYLQWLQQLTLDAAKAAGLNDVSAAWSLQTLAIEYHAPARDGDALKLATWVLDSDDSSLTRGYKVHRANGDVNGDVDETLVASARMQWAWQDRASGQPRPMPSVPAIASRDGLPAVKAFAPPDDNRSRSFCWRHTVRRYELDGAGQVGIAAWFHWLEEATFRATEVAGWTLARMREIDFMSYQRRHDAAFFGPAVAGDALEIVSRLAEVRRIRGMWLHEVYHAKSGALLMRDYSTGAFVTWGGQVRNAPMDMMDDLLKGKAVAKSASMSSGGK